MAKRTLPSIPNDIDTSKYLGLVVWIAKKYHAKTPILDSWQFSAGCVGLLCAKDRFDPNRNVKFETYAIPWIRHYILSEFKKKQVCQIPSEIDFTVDLTNPTEPVFKKDEYAQIQILIDKYLTKNMKKVMQLHYSQYLTFAAIGRMLNLSRQRIEQLHSEGLQRIRRKLCVQHC